MSELEVSQITITIKVDKGSLTVVVLVVVLDVRADGALHLDAIYRWHGILGDARAVGRIGAADQTR